VHGGKIYGPDSDSDSGTTTFGLRSGNAPYTPSSLYRRTSASALLQAASTAAGLGIGSKLNSYLDSDNVALFDDDFNIINWWHEHKQTYPVLSILAKDVLSVPVSTISSESAFSLTHQRAPATSVSRNGRDALMHQGLGGR